jgi:hypothetical protein
MRPIIYAVMEEGNLIGAFWKREDAEGLAADAVNGAVTEVPVPALIGLVNSYYEQRGLVHPNAWDAFAFLVSEIGELADALVSAFRQGWVRNNPGQKDIGFEGGDVLMLLIKFCSEMGFDPLYKMVEKFEAKGWKP